MEKISQYNIELLYIITFLVLFMLSAKFLVLFRFSYIFWQIPGEFWTWTDTTQISRISRFPGSIGNPGSNTWKWK